MTYVTIRNVDENLKRRFRLACLSNSASMREVLTDFMEDYVESHGTFESSPRRNGNGGGARLRPADARRG